MKEEKGLWLACKSPGDSTGGCAHGPTAMLCLVFLNSLDVDSLPITETQKSGVDRREMKKTSLSWPVNVFVFILFTLKKCFPSIFHCLSVSKRSSS